MEGAAGDGVEPGMAIFIGNISENRNISENIGIYYIGKDRKIVGNILGKYRKISPYMGLSMAMGDPHSWMVYSGQSQSKTDDD